MIYTFDSRVRYSEVDEDCRLTLPAVVNYFQDCSTFQSEDIGVGLEYLDTHKKAWILSSWQIVIDKYPKLGEHIAVSTWAHGFKGVCGLRNFSIRDESGENIVKANSTWVFMDIESGRPVRPSKEDVDAYGLERSLDMVYAPRKIKRPETIAPGEVFPIRHYHLDTNNHVNNCQYIQMALEILGFPKAIKEVRVEYCQSAHLGDDIHTWIAAENEWTVVELCNEEKQPYAIVSVRMA